MNSVQTKPRTDEQPNTGINKLFSNFKNRFHFARSRAIRNDGADVGAVYENYLTAPTSRCRAYFVHTQDLFLIILSEAGQRFD